MFNIFLKERLSWIVLYFVLHIILLILGYIDQNIALSSVVYYSFLSFLIFVVFISIRYLKEMKFYMNLKEKKIIHHQNDVPDSQSPLEQIVYHSLTDNIEYHKEIATRNQLKLEQEKDELLSWIHEVKTPLSAMQLIIDRIDDDKLKQDLNYEWLRIHLLLDQQLHLNRMAVIENDLYIEKIDLQQIVFHEIKAIRTWCLHKGIGFDTRLSNNEVYSDAKWVAFIVRQMITNAVKYSEHSDITISSFKNKKHVVLQIEDHGIGITSKDLPRIFEKGYTSQSNQYHNATGMGLYLSKKVSDALEIKIEVESTPGEGSTFRLIFPHKNEFEEVRTTISM
ncbi:sensor histidine kinase [Bacillaceae bacterium W0354]